MKCLVTGGAGFIGSHLVDRLLLEGDEVVVVDDMSTGRYEFVNTSISHQNLIVSDFCDPVVLNQIASGHFDYVFHLAAIPRVSYSVEHPLITHDINVDRSLRLLHSCKGKVKRFIFASSSSVYGGAETLPTPESYPRNPKSPYALQKSVMEDYLRLYYQLYGLDTVSLRFFNVFGPRQLGKSPYSTAVSAWMDAIKSNRSMRSDGDGSQTRDMCYVDNVVDACFKASRSVVDLKGRAFNVACDESVKNEDILKYLKLKYPNATHHDAPWRPGDVMHTRADITSIREVLGYQPLVRFWDGLEMTISWYEENWDEIKEYKYNGGV